MWRYSLSYRKADKCKKEEKLIGLIGHFGGKAEHLDGQTVKTKVITKILIKEFGNGNIICKDTYGGAKKIIKHILSICQLELKCKNVIILPAQNGIRVFVPLLAFMNIIFHRKLHYIVIGGWLPEFLANRKLLVYFLKKFNYIYVETHKMKNNLNKLGLNNVVIMPNCKEIKIINENEINSNYTKPYKLCTFSRVMMEKGIEIAVNAVKEINNEYGEDFFSLDIYGQVDEKQKEWFEKIKSKFIKSIKYCGEVKYNKSTDVLKEYYALIFPTYYDGEGFSGTIIDAMAAGVPIIASDWKYNSEIIHEKKTGLIVKNCNAHNLAKVIKWSGNHSKEWKNMKKECIVEAKKYQPKQATEILINNIQVK